MIELANRALIRLKSCNTGKYLRIMRDGSVNAAGGKGPDAVFIVHRVDANHIKLSSAESTKYWLQVDVNGEVRSDGNGNRATQFVVKHDSRFDISLSPVECLDWHLGATRTGVVPPCNGVTSGRDGRFIVERVESWPTNY
ncbi:Fibroblast growth factor family protein [Giardia muris]|uniref:Fibroblast growth factor family protein n=1 Tax=Giardia muris TaxID=5742 RepID=A0A4Z1STB5_GIAMU|nr:Fibroblast growth factor family protein [Giardia muris]|eukprot:TNJ29172.1 Fibroblast growth factor family protein [Giardia muris]